MTDLGSNEVAEAGIAGQEPSARGDAVGLVVELPGVERVELGEEVALEKTGVEGGDAVDGMAADDGEIGHADHLMITLLDEGEFADLPDIAGPHLLHLGEESLVGLENDLKVTRKHLVEEPDAPLLERLGKQRVVRVGEGPRDDRPCLLPGQSVDIVKESLEFDDGDGGMGVVELDRGLLGEIVPILIAPPEASDDVLERAGDEEILLDEAEFLAALGVVIGIEHLGNGLARVLVVHRLVVAAAVEGLEVEILRRLGGPEPQEVHGRRPVTRNGNVVGNADEFLRPCPLRHVVADRIEDILDHSVEFDLGGVLGADDLPGGAVFHPVVGKLHLVAVAELLPEETVLVMDAVSDRRQVKRRQRVEEAGRQTAQATVAEAHVVFLLAEFVDVEAEFPDRLAHVQVDIGALEAVDVEAPHQELQGEVVEPLHVVVPVLGLGGHQALDDHALDGLGGGQPPVALGSGLGIPREAELELVLDQGLETLDGGVESRVEFGWLGHGAGWNVFWSKSAVKPCPERFSLRLGNPPIKHGNPCRKQTLFQFPRQVTELGLSTPLLLGSIQHEVSHPAGIRPEDQ